MKICPKCQSPHIKPGMFCSRKCANSRSFSDEAKKKKADAYRNFYASLSEHEKIEFNINKVSEEAKNRRRETLDSKWANVQCEDLPPSRRKNMVLKEQGYKCLHCNMDTWLGSLLTMELDHIDGNNKNNKRPNLRALCPNCHSMTPTWRKGWKYVKKSPTKNKS